MSGESCIMVDWNGLDWTGMDWFEMEKSPRKCGASWDFQRED